MALTAILQINSIKGMPLPKLYREATGAGPAQLSSPFLLQAPLQ